MVLDISSRENPLVKRVVRLQKSKEARLEEKLFVAEGVRLCLEAAKETTITALFFTHEAQATYPDAIRLLLGKASAAYQLAEGVFAKIAATKTPQGVLCLCPVKDHLFRPEAVHNGGKFLVVEQIADPGNLGTILRSADAFGITGLVLTGESVELYCPKVVRAAMGALFRLPIWVADQTAQVIHHLHEAGVTTWAAVPFGDAAPLTTVTFAGNHAIVVGNEGHGLSTATIDLCQNRLTINMNGQAESLNAAAAAGILLWEMGKNP